MADLPPGWSLTVRDEVSSTNDALRALCDGDTTLTEGRALMARRQSAGRGRRGRVWQSVYGNLYLSVLLSRKVPSSVTALSLVAGVAVAQAIRSAVPESSRIYCKWPNDVLADGAKLCGILFEDTGAAAPDFLVAGFGINLVQTDVPDALYPVSDLGSLGANITAEDMAERVCSKLAHYVDILRSQGIDAIRASWLRLATGIGEPISVRLEDQTLEGRFAGLAEDGGLRLMMPSGMEEVIYAGDVFAQVTRRTGGQL